MDGVDWLLGERGSTGMKTTCQGRVKEQTSVNYIFIIIFACYQDICYKNEITTGMYGVVTGVLIIYRHV